MVTSAERSEVKTFLKGQGIPVSIIDKRHQAWEDWYKPNPNVSGKWQLVGHLPADVYHIQLYRSKGWMLNPNSISNDNVAQSTDIDGVSTAVEMLTNEYLAGTLPLADFSSAVAALKHEDRGDDLHSTDTTEPEETNDVPVHRHRFGRSRMALCSVEGCFEQRKKPYIPRETL